jgi:SRSO17 transposase
MDVQQSLVNLRQLDTAQHQDMPYPIEKIHLTDYAHYRSQLNSTEAGFTSLGLIIDESGWEKSGKKSVGVARQYIGQVGKVANGQVGVFAYLSNGEQVKFQGRRMWLYFIQTNE